MNRRAAGMHLMVLSATASLLLATGCGAGAETLQVSEARVGAPTGPNAALYFTVRSHGEPDALISVSTEHAAETQLHETVVGEEGTMSMQQVPRLEVPVGDELVLEPGGYHVMLVGVDDLDVGDTIGVTLTWEVAGEMTIEAEVVEPADTMGVSRHDMDDMEDG